MINYLKHSDLVVRLALNILRWHFLPHVAFEGPSKLYPKRRTFAFSWLFLQIFVDIDNGEENIELMYNMMFPTEIEIRDEDDGDRLVDSILKDGLRDKPMV